MVKKKKRKNDMMLVIFRKHKGCNILGLVWFKERKENQFFPPSSIWKGKKLEEVNHWDGWENKDMNGMSFIFQGLDSANQT